MKDSYINNYNQKNSKNNLKSNAFSNHNENLSSRLNQNMSNISKNIYKDNKFSTQKSNISNISTSNSNRHTLENNISNINTKNKIICNNQRVNQKSAKSENLGNTIFKGQKFIDFQEPFNESIRPIKPQSRDFDKNNKFNQANKFVNNLNIKDYEEKNNLDFYHCNQELRNEEEYQVIENYSGCSLGEETNEINEDENNLDDEFEIQDNDIDNNQNIISLNQISNNINNKSLSINENYLKNKYDMIIKDDQFSKKKRENSIHFTKNVLNTERNLGMMQNDDLIRKSKYFNNLKIRMNDYKEYFDINHQNVIINNNKANTPEIKRVLKDDLINKFINKNSENVFDYLNDNNKNFPNFETIHSIGNIGIGNSNNQFYKNLNNSEINFNSDQIKEKQFHNLTERNHLQKIENNNNYNKIENKKTISFNPNNFNNIEDYNNHSNKFTNSNNFLNSKNRISNENTAKFNFEESNNSKSKNINEKENIENYILNNLNNFNKEILGKDGNEKIIKHAIENLDLNHFQEILLNAEKAINPSNHNRIKQKDNNHNNKDNNYNSNNITNFSSIPVDEFSNQNLNNIKDENNIDFINVLIQLKRGQRNDEEKNRNMKNTITKLDDDSQSYIKEILDICSDGNKNNNNNFNRYENVNQNDMNTINLNNPEIITPNLNNKYQNIENFSKNINNEKLYKTQEKDLNKIEINSNLNNNPTLNDQYNFKKFSNSLSPLRNNLNLCVKNNKKINYENYQNQNQQNDKYFNNSFYENSESKNEQINFINQNNLMPIFNGKNSESSNKNNTNVINQMSKQSSRKLETNDLIEITNRRKNFVNDISSVDGYFRRRHLETLSKLEKIKKEKSVQEEKENNHIPKINKKSREIANRICSGSIHNIQINQNNQVRIFKDKFDNFHENNHDMFNENFNNFNKNNDVSSYSYNNVVLKNNYSDNKEYLINSQPQQNINFKMNVNLNNNSILRELGKYNKIYF